MSKKKEEITLSDGTVLEQVGWVWPLEQYPNAPAFTQFLPCDGGDPPIRKGIRVAYAKKLIPKS